MSYKKTRLIYIIILLFIIVCSSVNGQVKGRCKDCHTMHYSYEGEEVTYGNQKGPFPVLTKGGCIGCHGQNPSGTENIVVIGKTRIPQVLHNMENGDLAGGNFYYVADGYNPDYTKGHNVKGISLQEYPPKNVPPGFIGGILIPGGTNPSYWPSTQQLSCAGTYGCHGNRTIENPYKSIYGAHHEKDTIIDGETVGKSYRFLFGIVGKEHEDWEYQATNSNHNGYKGSNHYDSINTISYLCGECHAKFHAHPNLGGINAVSLNGITWTGHPADVGFDFVHGGFVGSEYQGYTTYNLEAPVAFENPTGKEKIIDENSIVMCLSCHKAHASNYLHILRWDYSKISTETPGQGCLICHTKKVGK